MNGVEKAKSTFHGTGRSIPEPIGLRFRELHCLARIVPCYDAVFERGTRDSEPAQPPDLGNQFIYMRVGHVVSLITAGHIAAVNACRLNRIASTFNLLRNIQSD